ncbi:hypothetical protein SLEP1_g48755 [Rubroshorea leprosula]|uniref:CCHC-type domain-containing protein n=1 Tax=Rubroshorea leprosula TaxID=152421 RepID=A0AAV5LVR8_9ROSI|nr:hypothetical protein SLEP1_g48755 [Rubroshorea leprosula]
MAQFLSSQPLEGLSTTKPPLFDGTNYNYWKNRMKVFMLANVPKAWVVTMKGPYVPMKIVGEREVPKEEIDWNDEDLEKIMINNKAINMLQCALNPMEFHRVSGCDTAKEMWDMLKVTHEGTSQSWDAKKMAIEEFKDLNTLRLEDLIGKLMTYEIEVQGDGGVEVVEKKKKNVAFKASNQKKESEDDASNDESSNEEDITKLISKEVKRFMKKNIKSKLARRDKGESTKKSVKCYECNKMGHYRNECPKLKKGEKKDKKKKKAFVATWSDDETSSTESESSLEKGFANLCFMAQEDDNNDEVNSNFSSSINESSFEYSYDDLCKVLDCSINDIKKLGNDNIALTKTISLLRTEIESLSKQNEVLVKENASLNGEIASLKNEESNNALKKENGDLKKGNEDLKKENEVLKRKACDLENVISKFTLTGIFVGISLSWLQEGLGVKGNKWVVLAPVVKLKKKKFSPKDICAVLNIPEEGDDEFLDVNHALVRATIAPNYTENQIKVGFLTPENRALQWIISRIIAQRKGSKSYVLASDLPWFDYLLNGKRVNLGRYIFRSIIKPYSPTTGLPHGALITRLAKRNNIDLTSFRFGTVLGGTTLTKASFEKMDCLFRNGIWIKKGEREGDEEEGDTDQEMAEQGAEEHEDDSPRPFRASMQRINRETMELMISEMQQLHIDCYGFRTEMRGRMTNVEGKLDRLVNHFFPPPPPDAT